jgi:hypothetical protein
MGDTEFDSFFEEGEPQEQEPVAEATEDPFGDAPADAPEAAEEAAGEFDFGDAPAADANAFADPEPAAAEPVADMGMGDMSGMDMRGAFVTSSNLSDSGPLSEWRAANRVKMEERAAASKEELNKILAQAQSDRDAFYAQRKQTIEATVKANREAENSLKESRAADAVKDNLWESVTELVDMQAKADGSDISRMRQTMLAMKND